ncbi:hypothetical protein [Streptomyces atriruber]|nr:hypothetical protein [Streptomyces atriruber]
MSSAMVMRSRRLVSTVRSSGAVSAKNFKTDHWDPMGDGADERPS